MPSATATTGTRRTTPSLSGMMEKDAMPIRRSVKNRQIPQQMRKVDEVKAWIGSDRGDSDLDRRMRDRSTSRDTIARLPEHNLRLDGWLPRRRHRCRASWRSVSRVAWSRPWNVSAATSGELRSGSGKSTSKPMTVPPCSTIFETISAITVRGHGHCPKACRLRSSISTTATSSWRATRGYIS